MYQKKIITTEAGPGLKCFECGQVIIKNHKSQNTVYELLNFHYIRHHKMTIDEYKKRKAGSHNQQHAQNQNSHLTQRGLNS